MSELGTLEDLPQSYRDELTARNLVPLWPSLRAALPHGIPTRRTIPMVWSYSEIRPKLMEAGELTPIEKAERRVLVLANPGLGLENMQATPTIYTGMQLILPGETAPNHIHTPSAVRFVVEGEGGYTVVNGEKLPMERGDLILTPSGLWHEHGHDGDGPVVWLDALDLPTVFAMEASYCREGEPQQVRNQPDLAQTHYRRAGLVPYSSMSRPRDPYALKRFPWKDVKASLQDLATVTDLGSPVQLAYVNPETGESCMPVLGFSALMLRPEETVSPVRRSASAVLHVVEGAGSTVVDGKTLNWSDKDSFAIPTHAEVTFHNGSDRPAFLFQIDDAPMQQKLGFYEEFPA